MAQVQVEMKAYCCEELWFLCSTPQSASITVVYFDSDLWEKIWGLVKCLYEPEKPTVPTKLHPTVKDIKLSISRSKQENTKFLCEVPTVTGQYRNVTLAPNFASPYCPFPVRELINHTPKHVTDLNAKLSSLASTAFKQCHEVLHEPGKELLVFMLTDKDRKQDKNIPYSYPVAYALKGSSMTSCQLQYLVDKLRNELKERKISILAETYDGQWHKHITESREGKKLTKLHG